MPALPDFATCKKVGFIVPSSNTVVEPVTYAVFQSLGDGVICLFTRIQVKTVGTDSKSTSQFSTENMIAAAKLLADAQVDAILWNGTSGMWTGGDLDADRRLAETMQQATGVPCSTTTLATFEALGKLDRASIGIAVPYTQSLAEQVKSFFAKAGYGPHTGQVERLDPAPSSNSEIAKSSLEDIRTVVKQCTAHGEQAVVIACTNWPAAAIVDELEKETGALMIDSVLVTIWHALRMIRFKSDGTVSGWGKLMSDML